MIRVPLQLERKRELQKLARWAEPRLEEQVGGGYDFEFDCGCGYDDVLVFLPDRHPVGVGALERTDRPPSFLGTASYNEGEAMPNVADGMVTNAFYNRTL